MTLDQLERQCHLKSTSTQVLFHMSEPDVVRRSQVGTVRWMVHFLKATFRNSTDGRRLFFFLGQRTNPPLFSPLIQLGDLEERCKLSQPQPTNDLLHIGERQGFGLGLEVSVSRQSRELTTSRLGLGLFHVVGRDVLCAQCGAV